MGRKEIQKTKLHSDFFRKILKQKGLSINKITTFGNPYYIGYSRKTITRALNSGEINPTILNTIAEKLNVDPYYLSGQSLLVFPKLEHNESYCDVSKHQYDKQSEHKKLINENKTIQDLLLLHNVSKEQLSSLSEEYHHGFNMELDLLITMLILKYFHNSASKDSQFLNNDKLYEMSCKVLSGNTYNELFDLLEA